MGISGLLPFLKNASRPVNIKELKAGREQSFVLFAKLYVFRCRINLKMLGTKA